jgi:peptide deformylase
MTATVAFAYPAQPALVEYPHPALRRPTEPVTVFDQALRDFCAKMFLVMEAEAGVGLAAPQVGVSRRIFITDHLKRRSSEESAPIIWINPRIERTEGTETYEEGCLSFPGIYAKVTRPNRFDVVYQDEYGVERRRSLDVQGGDFLGIVVQHELDHLEGRLFVDHLTPLQFELVRKKLGELEKAYRKATGQPGTVIRR